MTEQEKEALKQGQSCTTATRAGKKAVRQVAETIDSTPDQQISVELQVINAQNALQQGLLKTAQANSDVLANQTIQLTKDLTEFKVALKLAQIFEGENNVADVTTAFLLGTAQSGYQIADAIAKLEVAPPLLYQAICATTEAQPLLSEATEVKQIAAA